jgi:hypothetical protein
MMDPEPRGHKVTLAPDILDAMDRYLKSRLNQDIPLKNQN